MSDVRTRFLEAFHGQAQQQPGAAVRLSRRTTRDLHPARGSEAIAQAFAAGASPRAAASLNVRRADGTQGRAFCFDVPDFGWNQGEFGG